MQREAEVRGGRETGAVTLMILLLLIVFVVIFGAYIQYISRQSNQTVNQEQEEQAFGLADAGVSYTLWLLSPTGGGYTPQELLANPPAAVNNHAVTSQDNGETIGTFTVWYQSATDSSLTLSSIGRDAKKPTICQQIEAELQLFDQGAYRVTNWNHLAESSC